MRSGSTSLHACVRYAPTQTGKKEGNANGYQSQPSAHRCLKACLQVRIVLQAQVAELAERQEVLGQVHEAIVSQHQAFQALQRLKDGWGMMIQWDIIHKAKAMLVHAGEPVVRQVQSQQIMKVNRLQYTDSCHELNWCHHQGCALHPEEGP